MVTPHTADRLGNRSGSRYPPGTDAFFRRWVACTVAGEALGFTVAAALAATRDLSHMREFGLLIAAGAIEGALLGRAQSMAMSRLQLPAGATRGFRRTHCAVWKSPAMASIVTLRFFVGD